MYCSNDKHDFVVVSAVTNIVNNEEYIIKWCKKCGSLVGDVERDGNTFTGEYFKMMIPEGKSCIIYKVKAVSCDSDNKLLGSY